MTMKEMGLPEYYTVAGHKLEAGCMDHEDVHFCIQCTTVEEVRAYAEELGKAGFTQYAYNEISAGSEAPYFANLFYTYVKEEKQIFISWFAALHVVHVVVMPSKALPATTKPELCAEDTTKPTFTMLKMKGGLCLIAQLADAGFVIIDGGNYYAEDAQRLYEFLKDRTPKGKKPVIEMWLFTHMHCDHIDLPAHFIKDYAEQVEIRSFAQQFQDCKTIKLVIENIEKSLGFKIALEENIKEYYAEADYYTLHAGQKYYFKGMEMEILWTGDDMYPAALDSFNELSVACRMTFDSGKTAMILGDCSHDPCRNLADIYGDYLKSDVLQLAHHGLIGGNKRLYQYIDPEVCFWATPEARFKGELAGQVYQWCIGEGGLDYNAWIRDPKVRVRQHYHNSITTTIDMQ